MDVSKLTQRYYAWSSDLSPRVDHEEIRTRNNSDRQHVQELVYTMILLGIVPADDISTILVHRSYLSCQALWMTTWDMFACN